MQYIKRWNGDSTHSENCFICNKKTGHYIYYESKGITITIHIHDECIPNIDIKDVKLQIINNITRIK